MRLLASVPMAWQQGIGNCYDIAVVVVVDDAAFVFGDKDIFLLLLFLLLLLLELLKILQLKLTFLGDAFPLFRVFFS